MDFAYCPSCKGLNAPSGRRCGSCGAPLPEEEAAPPPLPLATAAPPAAGPSAAPDVLVVQPGVPPPDPSASPAEPPLPPAVVAQAEALEEQLLTNPSAKAPYMKLAQLYQDAGRKDLAIRVFERALAVDPANPLVRHRLSLLQKPAGQATTPAAAAASPAAARMLPRAAPPRPAWRRKALIAAAVLAVLAVVPIKMFVFPSTRLLVGGPKDAVAPRWSPRGDRIAFLAGTEGRTSLSLYDLKSGSVRELAPVQSWAGAGHVWSPTGVKIAYVSSVEDQELWGEAVYVHDLQSGQSTRLAMGSSPTWSPDGLTLAMICSGAEARAAAASAVVPMSLGDEGETYIAAPPPSADADPGLCLVNSANGAIRRIGPQVARTLAFSPDGSRIVLDSEPDWQAGFEAAGATEGTGKVPEYGANQELNEIAEGALANQPTNLIGASTGLSRELEARGYGKKQAAGPGSSLGSGNVFVVNADGTGYAQLTTDNRSGAPSWSPDGRRILYLHSPERGGTEVWSMGPDGATKESLFKVPAEGWDPSSVAVTPDGRRVIFPARVQVANEAVAKIMTGESAVDLHLAEKGGAPRRLENRHPFKQRFALSPDGRRIVYEFRNDKTGRSELWLMSP